MSKNKKIYLQFLDVGNNFKIKIGPIGHKSRQKIKLKNTQISFWVLLMPFKDPWNKNPQNCLWTFLWQYGQYCKQMKALVIWRISVFNIFSGMGMQIHSGGKTTGFHWNLHANSPRLSKGICMQIPARVYGKFLKLYVYNPTLD